MFDLSDAAENSATRIIHNNTFLRYKLLRKMNFLCTYSDIKISSIYYILFCSTF